MKLGRLAFVFCCAASFLVISPAFAKKKGKKKKQVFYQGQINVQAGTSFVSFINPQTTPDYTLFGDVKKSFAIPIEARLDYGISDNLGFGLFVSSSKTKLTITDVTDAANVFGFDFSVFTVGARGTYHISLGKKSKIDPYGYAVIGFSSVKGTAFGANNFLEPKKGNIAYSVGAGANVMLSTNAGIYAEVGYGLSVASLGLALKF